MTLGGLEIVVVPCYRGRSKLMLVVIYTRAFG